MGWQSPVEEDRAPADAEHGCGNCKIAIEDGAVERDGRTYCCDGCADGGPCVC